MTKEAIESNGLPDEDFVSGQDEFGDVWDDVPRGQPGPYTSYQEINSGHAICSGYISKDELVNSLD